MRSVVGIRFEDISLGVGADRFERNRRSLFNRCSEVFYPPPAKTLQKAIVTLVLWPRYVHRKEEKSPVDKFILRGGFYVGQIFEGCSWLVAMFFLPLS